MCNQQVTRARWENESLPRPQYTDTQRKTKHTGEKTGVMGKKKEKQRSDPQISINILDFYPLFDLLFAYYYLLEQFLNETICKVYRRNVPSTTQRSETGQLALVSSLTNCIL